VNVHPLQLIEHVAAPLDVARYDIYVNAERCFIGVVLDDVVTLLNIEPESVVYWIEENGRVDSVDVHGRDLTAVTSGDNPDDYEAPHA
jgi:hypothetical protein